uniref:Uncharacterized protein n=1 Tax=Yersinia ruckeri TaxID=29486 RepID=A0A0A8VEY9_YERRU|nr:hypothetical protein CSF007_5860 [Yersinia ruckeri]
MLTEQLLLVKIALAQHFCARSFVKGNVARVINHATSIGIFKIDANRPSKQRITHSTSQ